MRRNSQKKRKRKAEKELKDKNIRKQIKKENAKIEEQLNDEDSEIAMAMGFGSFGSSKRGK